MSVLFAKVFASDQRKVDSAVDGVVGRIDEHLLSRQHEKRRLEERTPDTYNIVTRSVEDLVSLECTWMRFTNLVE
jgi:hypothetical protein